MLEDYSSESDQEEESSTEENEDCQPRQKKLKLNSQFNSDDEIDDEDAEEEEFPAKPLASKWSSLFNRMKKTPGSCFTVGNKLSKTMLPGLEVMMSDDHTNDYVPISLPISNIQAMEIIKYCTKAPYGKGEETIVDESVRKTWQLEPSNFRLTNPEWDGFISELVNTNVRHGLDVDDQKTLSHTLYKLLLYEEGGHFQFHRDTGKLINTP